MTALDLFVLLLLGGGAIVGFVRGFVHEALALLAWVAGIAAVKLAHAPVQAAVTPWAKGDVAASAIAFAVIFLPVYVIVRLLARRLGAASRRSALGPIDRLLGGGFGMLKGLIGATLVFLLANMMTDMVYRADAERPDWMTQSRTFPLLNASSRAVVDFVDRQRHRAGRDTPA
jgi:membrane protein required for colicin V production